uniref:Pentatricopeptide repeat-containing protein n=1 Tax=Oryza nivara TaxID=4536 RepID=A0A0E0HFG8_ORYNI
MTPRNAAALSGLLRGKNAVNLAPEQVPKLLATRASPARVEDGVCLRDPPGARYPLDEIPRRDAAVGANRVLFDYARRGMVPEVLDQFSVARRGGVLVDSATLSCVLKACRSVPDRVLGEQLHCLCVKCGHDRGEVSAGTSLVDMYMKCGSVCEGIEVFEGMPKKNVVTWTSLLTGCAHAQMHSEEMNKLMRKHLQKLNFTAPVRSRCDRVSEIKSRAKKEKKVPASKLPSSSLRLGLCFSCCCYGWASNGLEMALLVVRIWKFRVVVLIPVEFLRWVIIILLGGASSWVISLNLKECTEGADMMVLIASAAVLQFAVALFIKVFFFA